MLCMAVLVASSVASAGPSWNAFVIRNSTTGDVAPTISAGPGPGQMTFNVPLAGQKAGWGTNYMNGMTIGDIASISITRDTTASQWGPYMNFWVTDGSGGYAVLGNEPSNLGEWAPGTAHDVSWDVLKDATAKVYETGSGFITPAGSTYTFNDFAGYTIATPASHWGGTGAPDDLNAATYTAYGVNWIFGDTQSNYIGAYVVSDPTVTAVPLPAAVLLGFLGFGVAGTRLRKFV
jgi:hypothetical protein